MFNFFIFRVRAHPKRPASRSRGDSTLSSATAAALLSRTELLSAICDLGDGDDGAKVERRWGYGMGDLFRFGCHFLSSSFARRASFR